MVELVFGALSTTDVLLALLTGVLASLCLAIAFMMAKRNMARWIPRKFVHISTGSVIGLTVVAYSNLSGPALAAGIFLTLLSYAWAHRSTLIQELLMAGSREGETSFSTFAAGFMGMLSFALSFLVFLPRPEIFVAAILVVAWADASGEVIGRTLGGKYLPRLQTGKSVEGSLAVMLFSLLSMLVALALYSDTCTLCVVPRLLVIALGVAATEFFSRRWLDNFLLPLVTSTMLWLLVFPTMPLLGLYVMFG
ncbi:MAG: hypothetical protein HXY34_07645 [Candidatus Thorarchaeota archaeon]|nr:hypothetical protein [Candidatus Thorarchaeota archaeon]